MEVSGSNNLKKVGLLGSQGRSYSFPLRKKRFLVGSSQACEVMIPDSSVAGIHAVIESSDGENFKIYDMNTNTGTFVNGNKQQVANFKLGDIIRIGAVEVNVATLTEDKLPPAPLEMLDQTKKPAEVQPPVISSTEGHVPRVEYPLSADPNADFSEYIFEDLDKLYPIFNYQPEKAAVEVIISFQGRVYSVDYLPERNAVYHLTGTGNKDSEIEYAYLGKDEKVPFVSLNQGNAVVFPLDGYDCHYVGEDEKIKQGTVDLNHEGILKFENGDIQVFVRLTEAPPKVAHAPILKRDEDFKKYLLIFLFLAFSFLIPMSLFEVDKELEKEKDPERVATILYKRKLTVSKNKTIVKTDNKKKTIKQKSPKLVQNKKNANAQNVKAQKKVNKKSAKSGTKTAKKVGKVKRATPNKANVTKRRKRVSPKKGGAGSKATQRASKRATPSKSKGPVDTYKSFDFKNTVSSVLSKGGSLRNIKQNTANESAAGLGSVSGTNDGATLKTAKVSNNIGSLTNATSGKLDATKGVDGLVNKKSIYTAGLPYKTVILGGMDPDVIRQILIENIPQFRFCYQRALDSSGASFNGVVKLNFIIGASGHVSKAGVESFNSIPIGVKNCVVNVLRGIRFPEPLGGGVVEVNQPFNFYPVEK